ncbi:hypothetical protein H8356DRAFT_1327156 [Neocallimastix lanati (nom. inval.)]|nr:hypothetical protein H8356DRAFT_1327156 [Neocallimastix sp. JGI-2020a]
MQFGEMPHTPLSSLSIPNYPMAFDEVSIDYYNRNYLKTDRPAPFQNNNAVQQSCAATYTKEAEYISTSESKSDLTIYTYNQTSRCIISEINTKLKNIDVGYQFNYDNILKKRINIKFADNKNMLADMLAKDSSDAKILKFTNNIFIQKSHLRRNKNC